VRAVPPEPPPKPPLVDVVADPPVLELPPELDPPDDPRPELLPLEEDAEPEPDDAPEEPLSRLRNAVTSPPVDTMPATDQPSDAFSVSFVASAAGS
jgi:hypothetical protein